VTDSIKAAVIKKQKENPKLGCWRLSLFEYENQILSAATIWRILNENKHPKTPPEPLYHFSHPHQMWFIDHMHLKTLKDQTKVYSLIIIDGFSRVLLSDETVLSKGAIDAIEVLLNAFVRFGLPERILSDNAKAFTSFVYRLLMGVLRVGVRYTEPGHPWENPYAESLIGTLRAYFYPFVQRQKSVASIGRS
jgi:transposase InsO family protein